MYSRSIVDRIKIQIEILCENISDFIRRHSLRTPLLVLSGVAVMMTLRNARSTIDAIKSMRGSPFGHKKSLYSPYGRSTGASNSYGGGRSYASPYAGSANSGSNSYGGQGSRLQQSFGQQSQYSAPSVNSGFGSNSGYNQQQAIPSYSSGNLRGAASAPGSSFGNTGVLQSATSGVIGAQTVPQGMLHSFSSMPYFSGQIETLSAPDSPNFVGQALASNGAGKVLVVDGGGSMNAIFDSSMAMSAQQNGWKGVIINGFVLDPQVLQTMPLGVQALGANPSRGLQMMGQKNVPISIGGVMFSPGSFVNVDMNGISVSSQPSQGGFGGNGITSNGGYNNGGYNAGLNTGAQNYGGGSNGIQTPSYGAPNTGLNSNSYGSNAATAGLTQGVNSYGSGLGGGANGNSYGSGLGRGAGTGAQPYGSRGRPARGKSSYSYNSYGKNRRRKKPAKRTLMAMLLFICAIVWVLLGD